MLNVEFDPKTRTWSAKTPNGKRYTYECLAELVEHLGQVENKLLKAFEE